MSEQYLLDTNVIIRLLLQDNKNQLKIAQKYFKKAKNNELKLRIPLFIIVEAAHVFRTFYNIPKEEIIDKLSKIVSIPYVIVSDRGIIIEALRLYSGYGVDFIDCILFATARELNAKVLSFDKDFKKLAKLAPN